MRFNTPEEGRDRAAAVSAILLRNGYRLLSHAPFVAHERWSRVFFVPATYGGLLGIVVSGCGTLKFMWLLL